MSGLNENVTMVVINFIFELWMFMKILFITVPIIGHELLEIIDIAKYRISHAIRN